VVNKVEENTDAVDMVEDRIREALYCIQRLAVNGEVRLELVDKALMFRIVMFNGARSIEKIVPWLNVRLCIVNILVDTIRQMHEELSRATSNVTEPYIDVTRFYQASNRLEIMRGIVSARHKLLVRLLTKYGAIHFVEDGMDYRMTGRGPAL
jgi:hypothetical protein